MLLMLPLNLTSLKILNWKIISKKYGIFLFLWENSKIFFSSVSKYLWIKSETLREDTFFQLIIIQNFSFLFSNVSIKMVVGNYSPHPMRPPTPPPSNCNNDQHSETATQREIESKSLISLVAVLFSTVDTHIILTALFFSVFVSSNTRHYNN